MFHASPPVRSLVATIPDPNSVGTSVGETPRPVLPSGLRDLREQSARMDRPHARASAMPVLPFGHAAIDGVLPGGGLARGALHEVASVGPDTEHAAASALFVAGILARLEGSVLWVLWQTDLFAPGLAGVGLHPGR